MKILIRIAMRNHLQKFERKGFLYFKCTVTLCTYI